MTENDHSAIEAGLQNLTKDSFDDQTPQTQLEQYCDEVFDEYSAVLPDDLDRDVVHCYVTDSFKRKRGQAQMSRETPNGKIVSGHHVLRIAEGLITGDKNWEETVRHEIAHIAQYVVDGHSNGHGTRWKRWAHMLDCSPTACNGKAPADDAPYKLVCTGCGHTWDRHKRSKTVKQPELYTCSDCGEKLASYETGDPIPTEPTCNVDLS